MKTVMYWYDVAKPLLNVFTLLNTKMTMPKKRNPVQATICVAIALYMLSLLAACGSSIRPSDIPPAAVGSETGEYLIGPGDQLDVFVWRQPDLSVDVPVRPDGRISIPLVNDIIAVGKTPSQLASEIELVLAEYIRAPKVSVMVRDFVGTFGEQIRVLGQAVEPRAIPYRERLTLLDAIIEAGGLTEFAAGNRSKVIRTINGESEEIRVRIHDLVNKGKLKENMLLRPGDVIVIPEAVF